jgi:aspartate/methionine/tyrosine aminotransferase
MTANCGCYRRAWRDNIVAIDTPLERPMPRFPRNEIISLVGEAPRFDLAESVGPNLRVGELLGAGFDDVSLGYGTAPGDVALRHLIATGHGVEADDVVVTVGGMHALFLLAFTLCEPGDEAVVAGPVFPLARNVLTTVGATVHTLRFSFDRGYQPDLAELRRLLTPRTKLVSLASPQNPSGVAIAAATLREIVAMMQAHAPQAWLVLDETYREATYGSDTAAPSAATLGPRVVTVASLSKCHGAAGLRIGWAITRDAALREQLVTAKFNTVISCSALDEAAAVQVLTQRDRILGERRELLGRNRSLVEAWVARHAAQVEWVRPDAGALCCVRLKHAAFDDAAVDRFHAALGKCGVRVAPGPWFGEAARVFRLGFGLLPGAELRQALEGVLAALQAESL